NALGTPLTLILTNATGLPNAGLATQTANTVLGALTATTPSDLALPSCSAASSALTWTTSTGFGCNTISGGGGWTLTDGTHTVTGATQVTVTGGVVGGSTPNGTLTISASAVSFTPGTP